MSTRARQIHVPAADGLRLGATLHEPAGGDVRLTVVLSPAVGVWRSFYSPLATRLASTGHRVVTYDYRGLGESPAPERGWSSIRMQDWGERDMEGVLAWTLERWPQPVVALGHSAGGQLLGLCPSVERIRGVLGIGVQSGYWRHWPEPHRWLVATLWYLAIPGLVPLIGRFPGRPFGLGTDLPPAMARQWAAWGRDPDYLRGRRSPASARYFDRYRGPVLACALTDDLRLAPPAAVEAYLDFWPRARTEYREIAPSDLGVAEIGHFGAFRPEPGRLLWPRIEEWLAAF